MNNRTALALLPLLALAAEGAGTMPFKQFAPQEKRKEDTKVEFSPDQIELIRSAKSKSERKRLVAQFKAEGSKCR